MSSSKIDWVAKAHEIGPTLAAHAEKHDLGGTFVSEAYEVLEQHRFFSLAVPGELGGGDASFDELCDTIRIVAHYDPAAALSLSMHSHLVAAAVWKFRHGKPGEKMLRMVAETQAVLLSTGASDWIDSNGTMEKVDGGFRVSARKIFGSGGPAATVIVASARYEDPEAGAQVLHFPVPMSADGVSRLSDWNTVGMRGTGSDTLVFENVFVPDESIALRRPSGQWHPAWSVVITVAPAIYMAAYVGIAEAAAERALASASKKAGSPHLPYQAGELMNELTTCRTVWRSMVTGAANYDFAPDLGRADHALAAKTIVARAAIATVEKAMEVAGGRAYFREGGLERLLRDVHAAPYHPLPEKRQLLFSGRIALGRDPITDEPMPRG